MTPRKTRKINTLIPQELQALDEKAVARPRRSTTRLIHQTLKQVLEEIEIIGNTTAARSQIQAASSALFTVIEKANNAVLSVTGAPGIITQIELEEFCLCRDNLGRQPGEEWVGKAIKKWQGTTILVLTQLGERLNSRFSVGWTVEPGNFKMERQRDGVVVISDSAKEQEYREERARKKALKSGDGAGTSRIKPPSAEQLQAWFDLPSEPPQAEGPQVGN